MCKVDYERMRAFLTSYRKEYGAIDVDWSALAGIGFGWLDWLAYNIRRALWIECSNEEERKMGIGEVHETIGRIAYYASIKQELLKNLQNMEEI